MTRLTLIDPAEATGKARELLSAVEARLRFPPNMMRTMAVSPAGREGYLCFSSALGRRRARGEGPRADRARRSRGQRLRTAWPPIRRSARWWV
jgi:hypothetical protein